MSDEAPIAKHLPFEFKSGMFVARVILKEATIGSGLGFNSRLTYEHPEFEMMTASAGILIRTRGKQSRTTLIPFSNIKSLDIL